MAMKPPVSDKSDHCLLPKKVHFSKEQNSVLHFNKSDPSVKISEDLKQFLNCVDFCSLLSKSENTLPYVRLTLGIENEASVGYKTVGLLDTGCSWSICEYKTFSKIPNYKDFYKL